jgi:hypothetical protein
MFNSFAMMHAGLTGPQCHPIHRAPHCSGNNAVRFAAIFGISPMPEPVEATSVCYRGTCTEGKMQILDSIFLHTSSGEISMTVTAAHIPAIVALIAGILILIIPRLLNLVVAIYLICIGLIGLGVLKWLHM